MASVTKWSNKKAAQMFPKVAPQKRLQPFYSKAMLLNMAK